jgi:hypothetical protein
MNSLDVCIVKSRNVDVWYVYVIDWTGEMGEGYTVSYFVLSPLVQVVASADLPDSVFRS